MGLDDGIDCINLTSKFAKYEDYTGRLGTTYASVVHNGKLYLGTNQGLFFKNEKSNEHFSFIPNTEGQVWSLKVIDDTLFCGHNSGTFLINGTEATLISSVTGTWNIQKIPNQKDKLLQGNYSGLYILERKNGNWILKSKVEGFNISAKHFEFSTPTKILVSHEYKGVYVIELSNDYTHALKVSKNETIQKGSNSCIVKFNSQLYYAYEGGVFNYNQIENEFIKNEEITSIFNEDAYTSGKLINIGNENMWGFTKNYIFTISNEKFDGSYNIKKMKLPQAFRHEMKGYENISKIAGNKYLIGTSSGYILVDISEGSFKNYKIELNSIKNGSTSENLSYISTKNNGEFSSKNNFIRFSFSVPEFEKYEVTEYQYNLTGRLNDHWSQWSKNSTVIFENLPYGDYTFKVKARVQDSMVENVINYSFKINRPWYISNLFIVLYIVLIVCFFVLLNWLYKRYYRNQRKKIIEKTKREAEVRELESQKKIVQLKNESLNQDIKSRNKELAISAMSLIKKNNSLSEIKEELLKLEDNKNVKQVIHFINKTLNANDDWEFFEKAFNHADKDFFKKLKNLHSELTPNDLRLCAYLRLNMSSKEIAPLLNISIRSVEVKRYRLRKKMNLLQGKNLTNYILEL